MEAAFAAALSRQVANEKLDWPFALADPTMGDQTYVYQSAPVANLLNNTWTGHQLAHFAGTLSLTIPNGGSVNLSGNMTAPGANNTVRANLATSQFVSLTSGIAEFLPTSRGARSPA